MAESVVVDGYMGVPAQGGLFGNFGRSGETRSMWRKIRRAATAGAVRKDTQLEDGRYDVEGKHSVELTS